MLFKKKRNEEQKKVRVDGGLMQTDHVMVDANRVC